MNVNQRTKSADLSLSGALDIPAQVQSLFLQAPIALAIFRGPEYVVELANTRMLEIWDKTSAQVLNLPLFAGMPEAKDQGYEQMLSGVYITGRRFITEESPVTLLRNGKLEKIYIKFVCEALRQSDDTIYGVMAVADEVTAQVRGRQQTKEAEERLRLATEGTNLATWDLDLQTLDIVYSPRLAELFGHSRDFIFTHPEMRAQIHPEDRQTIVEKAFEWALSTGFYEYEARVVWPGGTIRWVRTRGRIIYDDQRAPLRMLGTMMDITEQKEAEAELERRIEERTKELQTSNKKLAQSNKALEQYAHIASHDLQEPLRKIKTFSELMIKNVHDSGKFHAYHHKIVASTERMSSLIKDVLDYSKLSQANQLIGKIDLNEIVELIKQDFELLIGEKNATITYDPLPVIEGVPRQINQIFSNLISNSLKFSEAAPVIDIRCRRATSEEVHTQLALNTPGPHICLTFTDNGIGFEQEYAEKIFDVFQRLHSRQFAGTGIGLASCKRMVENHHGSIHAFSELQKGTVFTVFLPVKQPVMG